jgi:hypothetical protein
MGGRLFPPIIILTRNTFSTLSDGSRFSYALLGLTRPYKIIIFFDKIFPKPQINALKTREFWTKKYFARKNAEKRVQF